MSLFIKALKMTSNLPENSGTVEYFAGQSNFRFTGPQGKWLKKLSLSPESLEGARASTGLSLLCVDLGYKQWSNDRPLCA